MIASSLSPCFDTFCLPVSSLRCKVLCLVMCFLVLFPIFRSSSLINVKNIPVYITRGRAQVFVTLMRFLPYTLVTSIFLLFFNFFYYIYLFGVVCFQYFQVLVSFLFSDFFLICLFSWFVFFLDLSSVFCRFPLLIVSTANSILIYWLYPHYLYSSSSSSSSSCRAASTDILDHLSLLLPIIYHLLQVFWVTSCVLT